MGLRIVECIAPRFPTRVAARLPARARSLLLACVDCAHHLNIQPAVNALCVPAYTQCDDDAAWPASLRTAALIAGSSWSYAQMKVYARGPLLMLMVDARAPLLVLMVDAKAPLLKLNPTLEVLYSC